MKGTYMQTVEGGKKTAKTNKEKYGDNFYSEIGRLGGIKSRNGGFAKRAYCDCSIIDEEHTKPQCAGVLGGRKSRKNK